MAKKKISYDLFGKLQLASIEREVEDAWNGGISLFFADSPIEHPFSCDGYISDGLMLRLIIEYKFDEILSNTVARARVLVQVLFYLKRFEEEGLPLPNVIMVADKNECFVIHANDILGYLDENVDWSIAPSSAADNNPFLIEKVAQNDAINPFIFTVGPAFDLAQVVNRVKDLAMNVKRYVRVTEHNIAQIFDYYSNNVLRDPDKLEPHQLVESFIGVILEPDEYYLHPRKKNVLVTKFGEVSIFKDAFVFFTPTPFVDYAHSMLEKELGKDWKERYVVWDCCCGTKNLTRDHRHDRRLDKRAGNEMHLQLQEGHTDPHGRGRRLEGILLPVRLHLHLPGLLRRGDPRLPPHRGAGIIIEPDSRQNEKIISVPLRLRTRACDGRALFLQ